MLATTLLVATLTWCSVSAAVVQYNLTLTTQFVNPDGYWRSVIAINGSFPAPTLYANVDDILVVQVTNLLSGSKSVSVHWHGLSALNAPYMDGAAGVTQYPIVPSQSFTYRFHLYEPGTHLYHAHVSGLVGDGLVGALIVRSNRTNTAPSLYDDERVLLVQDWYHESSAELIAAAEANGAGVDRNGNLAVRYRPYALVNGQGRTSCSATGGSSSDAGLDVPGAIVTPTTGGAPTQLTSDCDPNKPFAVIPVTQGLRYRLRIVGASSRLAIGVSIASHPMTVVAVQGTNTLPVTVTEVQVPSGFRYDVIFTANQPIDNYWIQARVIDPAYSALAAAQPQSQSQPQPPSNSSTMASNNYNYSNNSTTFSNTTLMNSTSSWYNSTNSWYNSTNSWYNSTMNATATATNTTPTATATTSPSVYAT